MQATAKTALSSLVEDHLTSLVREAACVQRHSKRARHYNPSSTSSSEHPEGAILRARLDAQDINLALQWRGSEKLYATSVVVPPGPGQEDPTTKRVDLSQYLHSENRIPPPSELGLTSHWLAVDGHQPPIPQNPTQLQRHFIQDDQEKEDSDAALDNNRALDVRQLLPRLLSEELQLYFTRITIAIERGGATPQSRQDQDLALKSLARDTGLQELVPFFVRYISKHLYQNVNHPAHARTLIRLTQSLLQNPNLHLELHLHQLLPPLITCVVAAKLSASRMDNHWSLRQEAARTLLFACNLFEEEYSTLKARVLRTLVEATGPQKALTTLYGGLVGITLFGSKAVDAFVLPLVFEYWAKWEAALSSTSLDPADLVELQMCQQALLNALAVFLQRVDPEEKASRISIVDLEELLGDKLVPLLNDATEYAHCVL